MSPTSLSASRMRSLDSAQLVWNRYRVRLDQARVIWLEGLLTSEAITGWVVENQEQDPQLNWVFYLAQTPALADTISRLKRSLDEAGGELDMLDSVEQKDWAEVWKEFYHPRPLGQKFVVCPSWLEYQPKEGEEERHLLHIDPGMAFGTGYHETTRLALELLESSSRVEGGYVLDYGTGSGILAIAALLLKADFVEAYDYDPVAVEVAGQNISLHEVEGGYSVGQASLAPEGTLCDLVVANIIADVLVECAPSLLARLKPGGDLILSGIIDYRLEELKELYLGLGCELKRELVGEDWRALLLTR